MVTAGCLTMSSQGLPQSPCSLDGALTLAIIPFVACRLCPCPYARSDFKWKIVRMSRVVQGRPFVCRGG